MQLPFLDDATFRDQVKAASKGSEMTLEDAYAVIDKQNSEIRLLDGLVIELQAEKASLETQLANYQGLYAPRPGTPSNPTVTSDRPILRTSRSGVPQHCHVIPATTVSSPSHSVATARNRFPDPPPPIRRSVLTTAQPSSSPPVRPARYQAVTPLRPIGPETEAIFNYLQIPDLFHRDVYRIVEQVLQSNWEESLLELGCVDADNVHDLVEAMKIDVSSIPSC